MKNKIIKFVLICVLLFSILTSVASAATLPWDFPKITVTYELNGGTLASGITSEKIVKGEEYTLPIPTRDGYEFANWYKAPDFSGLFILKIPASQAEDITLYARWREAPVTPTPPLDPDTPVTPDIPDTPTTPDAPDNPVNPDTPGTPNAPTDPDVPEEGGNEWITYVTVGGSSLLAVAVALIIILKKKF